MTSPTPDHQAPDEVLVARVASGQRDALEALYQRHAGWLTARLSQRCADADLVDIAVQDTFLAVWRGAKRYRAAGDVGAWIWGIGIRRLIDQLRKRRPIPTDRLPADLATPSAEDHTLAGGAYGPLAAAFGALPPELQAALQATVIDGLTTREASILLAVPQGTVKTRVMRARRQLRELLQ